MADLRPHREIAAAALRLRRQGETMPYGPRRDSPAGTRDAGERAGTAMADQAGNTVEIDAPDPDDLDALYDELRGVAGLSVEGGSAPAEPGEQGPVLEFLTVACSGGAITVFLQIIKTLAESRGPKFSLKIRRGRDRLEVTADNVDDVLPVIRKLLDGK